MSAEQTIRNYLRMAEDAESRGKWFVAAHYRALAHELREPEAEHEPQLKLVVSNVGQSTGE